MWECFKYWTRHVPSVFRLEEEDGDVVQHTPPPPAGGGTSTHAPLPPAGGGTSTHAPLPPPYRCTLTQAPPPRSSDRFTPMQTPLSEGCLSMQTPEALAQAPPSPLEQNIFQRRHRCKEWAIQVVH